MSEERKELLHSREYWITKIRAELYQDVFYYLQSKKQNDLALKLKVSKGYISQILKMKYDHKISKLVDLCLAIGKAPIFTLKNIDEILKAEEASNFEVSYENMPIQQNRGGYVNTSGIKDAQINNKYQNLIDEEVESSYLYG